MEERRHFTIETARRNRITDSTRGGYKSGIHQIKLWAEKVGKHNLLSTCTEATGGKTLNLSVFQYEDFLSFVVWTVRNKRVGVKTLASYRSAVSNLYKENKIPLPEAYGDDMKDVLSGIHFLTYIA